MIKFHMGECLDVLKTLPDSSVDAVVCDPPYGLSNTKPAQVADVLKAWVTGDTSSVPAKRGGFMGKDWDSFVPPPAVWEECMRVLKPGGHMAVFAGARTQDLMGLSIRLAGFEICEGTGWIYGSGFPKSMDISKAIDKQRNDKQETLAVTSRLSELASAAGISRKDIDSHMGTSDMGGWWLSTLQHRCVVPSVENWAKLRDFIPGAHELDAEVWRLNGRKGTPGEAWGKREVISERPAYGIGGNGILNGHSEGATAKITTPATSEAVKWDGWGTALKPAIEPIILARKPLGGASRLSPAFKYQAKAPKRERPVVEREDGTKIQHATVKPLALMEWLVELITPPGGVVLDPFAGSGTTLEAARNKGFPAIGIEREPDYIRLIETRLGT